MTEQAVELISSFDDLPKDEEGLQRILTDLPAARAKLVQEQAQDELVQLAERLATWSEGCDDGAHASQALRLAASMLVQETDRWEHGIDLYERALQRDPADASLWPEVEAQLSGREAWERMEAVCMTHAEALDERALLEPELRVEGYRRLGQLRAEHLRDLDMAIDAYQSAVEIEMEPETVAELARLHQRRDQPGDRDEAADLYFQLGDQAEGDRAIKFLERALDCVPTHEAALDLLEQLTPVQQQHDRMEKRWRAFASEAVTGERRDSVIERLTELQGADEYDRDAEDEEPESVSVATTLPVAPSDGGADQAAQAEGESEPEPEQPDAARAAKPERAPLPPNIGNVTLKMGAAAVAQVQDTLTPPVEPMEAEPRPKSHLGRFVPILAAAAAMVWLTWPSWNEPQTEVAEATATRAATAAPAQATPGPQEPAPEQDTNDHAAPPPPVPATPKVGAKADGPVPPVRTVSTGTPNGYSAEPDPEATSTKSKGKRKRRGDAGPDALAVTMKRATLQVRGGHSKRAVAHAMEPVRAELERCYRQSLKRKPKLKGKLVYSVALRPHGRTKKPRYRGGSLKDGATRLCGLRALHRTRFPKSKGAASRVRVAFQFAPPAP